MIMRKYIDIVENATDPRELELAAELKLDPWLIEQIHDPSEKLQMVAVIMNPTTISVIKYPTVQVQLAAVVEDGNLIRHIKHVEPSEAVKQAAVAHTPHAIKYIKKPSPEVMRIAMDRGMPAAVQAMVSNNMEIPWRVVNRKFTSKNTYDGDIRFVITTLHKAGIDIPEYVLESAVRNKPRLLNFLLDIYDNNVSESVQLASMSTGVHTIVYLLNHNIVPSERVQLYAVENNFRAFEMLINHGIIPSRPVVELALTTHPSIFYNIKIAEYYQQLKIDPDLERLAVSLQADNIKYIEDPSVELQRLAIDADPQLIAVIKKPDVEIIQQVADYDISLLDKIKTTDPTTQVLVDFIRSHHG
jgi:hypothetical protein